MAEKLTLKDLDLHGKKVLMRVDFNVPLDKQNHITDDSRIQASIPSILYVLEHGGSVILMCHLGRPQGVENKYSLAPCAKHLSKLLNIPVTLAPNSVGKEVEALVHDLQPGQILMLENLRFHKGEEKPANDANFVKMLASLGDIYVNDAFGTAHRAHASTAAIAAFFPDKAAAGFLMEKEIAFLGHALLHPKKPFYAIVGGAKISSKIGVLKSLISKADGILIGGGMAYTFMKAEGIAIGESIHEDDQIKEAKAILELAHRKNVKFLLPLDLLIADKIDDHAKTHIIEAAKGIPDGYQGVDIGPKTIQAYIETLQDASTVFWNGPMGIFEIPAFAEGTNAIAQALADLQATTIVGGGESVAAVEAAGVADQITHLSTGGGAALEYIEHGSLPGIEALTNKHEAEIKNRK